MKLKTCGFFFQFSFNEKYLSSDSEMLLSSIVTADYPPLSFFFFLLLKYKLKVGDCFQNQEKSFFHPEEEKAL